MNLLFAGALGAALVAFGTGCDRPSDTSLAAYRAAQKSALDRVTAEEKALAASIDQINAGAWTARADLGACGTKLPPPPEKDEDSRGYVAWVVDSANPDSIAGWGHLPQRVFKQSLESVGDPDKPPPETETLVVGATKRLTAMDPTSGDDILFLYVDAIHRPAQSGESTFTGGDEHGRAWVWNPKSRTVVCASVFSSTTPQEVLATFFLSPEDRTGEVDSNLMLALRRASIRAAFAGLTAAGPPK